MPEGYLDVQPSPKKSQLPAIAREVFPLMMRNVATADVVYTDPEPPGGLSGPGCVLASPSFPLDPSSGKQNYVNNWTRDAAITMMEITAQAAPIGTDEAKQRMADYISFASVCQENAPPHEFSIACVRINGQPRCDPGYQKCWSAQSDGPALQTLAILGSYDNLGPVQDTARAVIERNLQFLLQASEDNTPPGVPGYQATTVSPWEEMQGYSFYARAVQLKCLLQVQKQSADPAFDVTVPPGLDGAITWLQTRVDEHWTGEYYSTFLPNVDVGNRAPYDPNSDILMACVYGAVEVTNPRLLATSAKIRDVYTNTDSTSCYPINSADKKLGYGPVIGRYPGDYYDGDVKDSPDNKDHPWILCTCNLAEIYYRLANAIEGGAPVPDDPVLAQFFQQIGLAAQPDTGAAIAALRAAGDSMLEAVVFHSDNLELSEQLDQTTGFAKSVSNLTWSYAALLSAVRARGR